MDGTRAFSVAGQWLKGALHVHTSVSDGKVTPDEAAAFYRRHCYDFVALTDHWRLAELSQPPPHGLTLLKGMEWDANSRKEAKWWHFVGLAPDGEHPPRTYRPEPLFEWARQHCRYLLLAHPYWSNLCGEDLCAFGSVDAVEVFNYGCEIELCRGHSEYPWDYALGRGVHLNAVAVDDCHWRLEDAGRGWVMVKATANEPGEIIEALRRGEFYSSTGAHIHDFRREGNTFHVHCSPATLVKFCCRSYAGGFVRAEHGNLIEHASFELHGGETYLRIEVIGRHGEMAWSNPVPLPRRKP